MVVADGMSDDGGYVSFVDGEGGPVAIGRTRPTGRGRGRRIGGAGGQLGRLAAAAAAAPCWSAWGRRGSWVCGTHCRLCCRFGIRWVGLACYNG